MYYTTVYTVYSRFNSWLLACNYKLNSILNEYNIEWEGNRNVRIKNHKDMCCIHTNRRPYKWSWACSDSSLFSFSGLFFFFFQVCWASSVFHAQISCLSSLSCLSWRVGSFSLQYPLCYHIRDSIYHTQSPISFVFNVLWSLHNAMTYNTLALWGLRESWKKTMKMKAHTSWKRGEKKMPGWMFERPL